VSGPQGVLALNAGSSTLKFAGFRLTGGAPAAVFRGTVGWPASAAGDEADATITSLIAQLVADPRITPIVAVVHRIVHGGSRGLGAERLCPAGLAQLEALTCWAPLHQPRGLAGVRAALHAAPGVAQLACFDTSFHVAQPEVAQRVALPPEFGAAGIRRYGFHGLSCKHAIDRLGDLCPDAAAGRVIVAHLGSGSSMSAIAGGHSIACSMGLTPLDGLPMASRCGALDPGIMLHLVRSGMSAMALEDLLYRRSGLLGISGHSGDMRQLLALEETDSGARAAVEYFVYRAVRETGSLAAALGGLDHLVFTGGIGENSAPVRARICGGLAWLGLRIDPEANGDPRSGLGTRVNAPDSRVGVWVIPSDEEKVMAAAAAAALSP